MFQLCRESDILKAGLLVRVALRFLFGIRGHDAANPPADADMYRFQTTIEMPCIKCGERMRLASIEPQGQNFDLVTYRCIPCVCEESFLQPV